MKMGNKSPNLKIVVIHSCTQDGRPLTHRTSSIKGYVSNEIESVTTAHDTLMYHVLCTVVCVYSIRTLI